MPNIVSSRGSVVANLIFIVVGLGIEHLYKLGAELLVKLIATWKAR